MAILEVGCKIQGTSPILYHKFLGESGPGAHGEKDYRKMAAKHLHTVEHPEQGNQVYIPGTAIFACLVNAGKFHKVGKSKMTTGKESLVPAYLGIKELTPLLHNGDGSVVTTEKGWEVDKQAVVNPSTGGRMMSYRPRVDIWSCEFTILLYEPKTVGTIKARELVDDAGTKIGLLAFRPQKKGPNGKFVVVKWEPEQMPD